MCENFTIGEEGSFREAELMTMFCLAGIHGLGLPAITTKEVS